LYLLVKVQAFLRQIKRTSPDLEVKALEEASKFLKWFVNGLFIAGTKKSN